jgi:hypothetical protein
MASAKDIMVKPIKSTAARAAVKKLHYSGKTTQNSQLHFGVFLNGKLEGCLQFGPPIDRRKMLPLVSGSKWGDMIELNRMAFSEALPRFSESRAIAICLRIIRQHYPQIKWVVSFADGCQCGDGTIYRASGFVLTAINKNSTMYKTPAGEVVADKTFNNSPIRKYKGLKIKECERLVGFQLRYIYFIDKTCKEKLTVPILPFSKIDEMGAGMYKGIKRGKQATSGDQLESGGAAPTTTLHAKENP